MREKWPKQMPLMSHILDHPQSRELDMKNWLFISSTRKACDGSAVLVLLKKGLKNPL
jgi:hypothetical protein